LLQLVLSLINEPRLDECLQCVVYYTPRTTKFEKATDKNKLASFYTAHDVYDLIFMLVTANATDQ